MLNEMAKIVVDVSTVKFLTLCASSLDLVQSVESGEASSAVVDSVMDFIANSAETPDQVVVERALHAICM